MGRATSVLCEGLYFGEAPRWREGRLWFSDFHAHSVMSTSLAGALRVEFEIDDRPSGLGWLPDGSLLVVSMTKRRVLRRAPNGDISIHADLSGIADFHCNDIVVDALGRAYVGNFGFDHEAELAARGREAVFAEHPTAKLALVSPEGAVRVAAEELHFPNGSVITPEGETLIVGETFAGRLTAFDIAADGSLSRPRVWASLWPRLPDGICLDAEGAIWVANPIARECVRVAEGGEILEVIDTEHNAFACMLGGEEGKTLFMMIAPSSNADKAAASRQGKILIANVDVPRAGLP